MWSAINKLVMQLLWLVQLGKPKEPGYDPAKVHASYVRRYSKILGHIEKAVDEYNRLVGPEGSAHDPEYTRIVERGLEHKAAAEELLGVLNSRNAKNVKETRRLFTERVIGLELLYNALVSVNARIKK